MFTLAAISLTTVLIALLLACLVAFVARYFGAPDPIVLLLALIVLLIALTQKVSLD